MQAYYTYLVTHFRTMSYDTPEGLTAFLMEQLRQQRSLYNVENALRAVYSSRRVPLVLTALETLTGDNQIFIHQKLLVDGLRAGSGAVHGGHAPAPQRGGGLPARPQ